MHMFIHIAPPSWKYRNLNGKGRDITSSLVFCQVFSLQNVEQYFWSSRIKQMSYSMPLLSVNDDVCESSVTLVAKHSNTNEAGDETSLWKKKESYTRHLCDLKPI